MKKLTEKEEMELLARDFKAITDLLINWLNRVPDGAAKFTWCMALAGNVLHDIPDELLDTFLEHYKEMKEDVNELLGN